MKLIPLLAVLTLLTGCSGTVAISECDYPTEPIGYEGQAHHFMNHFEGKCSSLDDKCERYKCQLYHAVGYEKVSYCKGIPEIIDSYECDEPKAVLEAFERTTGSTAGEIMTLRCVYKDGKLQRSEVIGTLSNGQAFEWRESSRGPLRTSSGGTPHVQQHTCFYIKGEGVQWCEYSTQGEEDRCEQDTNQEYCIFPGKNEPINAREICFESVRK
ncbi:hypothetical protein GOV07_05640 [Candidatus Woesearchaeota archaeon]|nr:hypothetical protein [Candidatus Woesearchaeota archaeon]